MMPGLAVGRVIHVEVPYWKERCTAAIVTRLDPEKDTIYATAFAPGEAPRPVTVPDAFQPGLEHWKWHWPEQSEYR